MLEHVGGVGNVEDDGTVVVVGAEREAIDAHSASIIRVVTVVNAANARPPPFLPSYSCGTKAAISILALQSCIEASPTPSFRHPRPFSVPAASAVMAGSLCEPRKVRIYLIESLNSRPPSIRAAVHNSD